MKRLHFNFAFIQIQKTIFAFFERLLRRLFGRFLTVRAIFYSIFKKNSPLNSR